VFSEEWRRGLSGRVECASRDAARTKTVYYAAIAANGSIAAVLDGVLTAPDGVLTAPDGS